MPAIQTAFGPIVEPGWPSTLPGAPDLGEKFLNAWSLGQQLRMQKSKLEDQMAMMALRERQMEINQDNKEKMFQLAQQRQDDLAGYRDSLLGLRQLDMDRRGQALYDREQKQQDQADDDQGFTNYVLESGVTEDDPKYPATLRAAKLLNPHSTVKMDTLFRQHNSRLDNMEKSLEADRTHYLGEIGEKHFGTRNWQDERPFLDPTYIHRAVKTLPSDEDVSAGRKSGRPMPPDLPNVRYDKTPDGHYQDVDGKIVTYPDPVKQGQPAYEFFPTKELDEIHSTLKSFDDRKRKIPPKVDVGTDLSSAPMQVFSKRDVQRIPSGQGIRFYWINPDTGKPEYGVKD